MSLRDTVSLGLSLLSSFSLQQGDWLNGRSSHVTKHIPAEVRLITKTRSCRRLVVDFFFQHLRAFRQNKQSCVNVGRRSKGVMTVYAALSCHNLQPPPPSAREWQQTWTRSPQEEKQKWRLVRSRGLSVNPRTKSYKLFLSLLMVGVESVEDGQI